MLFLNNTSSINFEEYRHLHKFRKYEFLLKLVIHLIYLFNGTYLTIFIILFY